MVIMREMRDKKNYKTYRKKINVKSQSFKHVWIKITQLKDTDWQNGSTNVIQLYVVYKRQPLDLRICIG